MTDRFELHPQLAKDTHPVGQTDLCEVLLSRDARYPWLILVPRVADIVEIHELGDGAQAQLWREVTDTGRVLTGIYHADKLNVAALGNVVPQLHVHVIARVAGDPAWPGPVWGHGQAQRYGRQSLTDHLDRLRTNLPVNWMMAHS